MYLDHMASVQYYKKLETAQAVKETWGINVLNAHVHFE